MTQQSLDDSFNRANPPRNGLCTPHAFINRILRDGNVGCYPSLASEYGVHEWASEYAEPGYNAGPNGILFGNWNGEKPRRFSEVAEYAGYSIEWSDEWSTCYDCNKAVRTSPDSYSYTPSYAIVNEGELLCVECIADNPSDYLDELVGKSNRCLSVDLHAKIDLEKYGFHKLNTERYESGFHKGQDDNPVAIAKELRAEGITEFLFVQTEQSQFYITFDVYARETTTED